MSKATIIPNVEEREWIALEDQRRADVDGFYSLRDCRPKFRDVPHPRSYRPDLPLRSELHGQQTKKWTLTTADKIALGLSVKAGKTRISLNAAHPDSYRPDLPLRGIGFSGPYPTYKWTLTAAEKRILAARPLVYPNAKPRTDQKRDAHTRVERPQIPQSVRDALRRAYIAQLGGRVQVDRETGKYNVTLNRTGKIRTASWDAIVRTKYPNATDFQQAAERWQSPSNERTRATH